MSSGSFNCVFCTDTFDSREELQVHFRQHGNPDLHASLKISSKKKLHASGGTVPGGEYSVAAESSVKHEAVVCDVCTEKFNTVARAIRHKHKFHPDYTVKHFCSWCGQLFPIKHLIDKHKTVHTESEVPPEVFRCDECLFDFYTLQALTYHNRSYHRDGSHDLNLVASKKYRIVNKSLVRLYFCFLCGKEFINNFNLQKHINETHTSEEWIEPGGEVLRCPRCDAVFHSESAYVDHLSYHTNDDVYVNLKEPYPELAEFTIQTVPPTLEKMDSSPLVAEIDDLLAEDLDISGSHSSQDTSEQASGSESNQEKKPKPPRKAITLNQFLSMNKDVFGDVFNFHGVEEVPSRVVTNQLRQTKPQPRIKPGTKVISAHNIQKLKQQGVVVKQPAVGNKLTVANGVEIGKPIRVAPTAVVQSQTTRPQPRPGLVRIARPAGVRVATSLAPVGKPLRLVPGAMKPAVAVRSATPIRAPTPIKPQTAIRSAGPVRAPAPTPVRTPAPARSPVAIRSPAPVKKSPVTETSVPGPFSCFKKPKESLIPISDVHEISQLMKSESAAVSTPPARPITSTVSSRPTTSPIFTASPTGLVLKPNVQLKPASKQGTKPLQALKPNAPDLDSNKSKTDEALEKLRKQGLLVKKPKLDSESSRESPPVSDAPCLTVKGGG